MIKTEYIERVKIDTRHSFYCDECNEFLGIAEEYDDGWFKELGELELSFYIDGWYKLRKCLCHSCAQDFLLKLKNSLKDFGFEESLGG